MSGRLSGKVALVTGGTSGIGLGIAHGLVAEGVKIFITGRNQARLEEAVSRIGGEVVGLCGDVADADDLSKLHDAIKGQAGSLDILVANAGVALHETLEQVTEDSYEKIFRTNVKGVFFTVQKLVPLMPDGAAIVVNASMWTIKGIEGFALLNASKAAVRSFVRTWAAELGPRRIRVNAVSPGHVLTPAVERAVGSLDGAQRLFDGRLEDIPLGRIGTPEDIAKAVVFLASNDAAYINGTELFVDGGMTQI